MSADLSAKEETQPLDRSDSDQNGKRPRQAPMLKSPKLWVAVGAVFIVITGLIALNQKPASDPNIVDISGRIEATETYITAGVGTRVESVNVKEGDTVHKGQILLTLDAQTLRIKMKATGSEEALARQAQGQAETQVSAAQRDVATARAKSKGFFAKIFASKKKKEEETAKLTQEMKMAQMQLFQAKAAIIKTQAAKGEVSSKVPYFTITSPTDGLCVTRSIEPGETVAPGQVLLSIINPTTIYMKGFIPEGNLSQVKIGQEAQITLDSPRGQQQSAAQAHILSARVTAIDTVPSFTPQNIYFKEDRIKQVFGIKLSIDNSDGSAKPGMPASAKIMLKQDK
jgi:multidrug resistance efflux pump